MHTFYKDCHIINVGCFLEVVYLLKNKLKLTKKKNRYASNLQAEETLKKKIKMKNYKKEI